VLASFAYKAGWETQKTLIAGGSERKTALFSPVRAYPHPPFDPV